MEKQVISHEVFEKKVEVESAYLQHYNNLQKGQADKVAREIVSEEFVVA